MDVKKIYYKKLSIQNSVKRGQPLDPERLQARTYPHQNPPAWQLERFFMIIANFPFT